MKRLKNLALTLFVSPEVLSAAATLAFIYFLPNQAGELGKSIRADSEIWKYLPALTLVLSGSAISTSFKVRAPLENFSNKPLYEWPLYQLLVDRVYISLFFAISSAIAALALWFLGAKLGDVQIAAIFLGSAAVSGTTALTMLLAQQKLRELIERHT